MDLFTMLTVIYKYKKLYEKKCCEIMKDYNLRIIDLDILYYIANCGPRNLAKDIVDLGMSKANVSKSVDHLRRKGLVRLKEDSEDRRCVHIEVMPSALPVIERVTTVRQAMEECLSKEITHQDRETAAKVLFQIGENMNDELESI